MELVLGLLLQGDISLGYVVFLITVGQWNITMFSENVGLKLFKITQSISSVFGDIMYVHHVQQFDMAITVWVQILNSKN